jgi:hypothetical protein
MFYQKSFQTAAIGFNMITWNEFNDYMPPAIAVFVLGFLVTVRRELGVISVNLGMIKELKEDGGKLKTELQADIGKIQADMNLFKTASTII